MKDNEGTKYGSGKGDLALDTKRSLNSFSSHPPTEATLSPLLGLIKRSNSP